MQKLLKFYFRHKKLCLAVIFFAMAAVVFVLPHTAFAETKDESTDSIVRDINGIFNTLLRMSSAWLWPVLIMTGSLLDNDLIFGGAMGERLLDIWVQIRNLVNIAFVLILLAIAVYNVLGIGEEGGGLPLAFKTAIPKFVLALIAVNFSFLAVKVILDFTNVITGAVFALPTNAITQEKQDFKSEFEKTICGTNNDEMPLRPLYCDGPSFNAKAQSFFSRLDRSNITLVYALRFGKAANLKFIRNDLQDIGQLGFNIIFNSILYIVYAVSFIVLFLVLLLRIVSLWVIVVLSPLIALGIVLPNLKELAGEGGSLQEKFLNDAIAPIKIGLVLSVSYIMLSGFEADKSIHGELLGSATLGAIDINSIPTDITDLQQLMIAVGMIVVIWVGVFSAAEKSTAKGLTGWIKGKLEGAGQFMASLPAYLQVIPVGGKGIGKSLGGKASLKELGGVWSGIKEGIEAKGEADQGRDVGRRLMGMPVISPEVRDAWRQAANLTGTALKKKIAEIVAQYPGSLKDPEGFQKFKASVMKLNQGMTEEQFKDSYGERGDYDKNARGLARDFGPEMRAAGMATGASIAAAIRADSQSTVATAPASATGGSPPSVSPPPGSTAGAPAAPAAAAAAAPAPTVAAPHTAPAGGAAPVVPPTPAVVVAQLVPVPVAGAAAGSFVDSATLATPATHPEFGGGTNPAKAWTVPQIDALRAHLATLSVTGREAFITGITTGAIINIDKAKAQVSTIT